jgi:hypothetical protein
MDLKFYTKLEAKNNFDILFLQNELLIVDFE